MRRFGCDYDRFSFMSFGQNLENELSSLISRASSSGDASKLNVSSGFSKGNLASLSLRLQPYNPVSPVLPGEDDFADYVLLLIISNL